MVSIGKKWRKKIYNAGIGLLLFAGCLQFVGYIFHSREIRGLGLAYGVAPLPTVFSTISGVEGFATRHTLYFNKQNGQTDSLVLDQRLFSKFHGHYFLKNAYTIFIAYPHILKPGLVDDGWNFALCRKNLLHECNLSDTITNPEIHSTRIRNGIKENIVINPHCNKP